MNQFTEQPPTESKPVLLGGFFVYHFNKIVHFRFFFISFISIVLF